MPGAANHRNSRRATPQSTNGLAGAIASASADWRVEVPAPAGKCMTIEHIQKAGRHRRAPQMHDAVFDRLTMHIVELLCTSSTYVC